MTALEFRPITALVNWPLIAISSIVLSISEGKEPSRDQTESWWEKSSALDRSSGSGDHQSQEAGIESCIAVPDPALLDHIQRAVGIELGYDG